MLEKVKNILENNLYYNLIILMGFNISIVFSTSILTLITSLIFGAIVAYKLISSQEKDFSEKKKQILNEDFNSSKIDTTLDNSGTNLLNEVSFPDKKTMEDLIKGMFPNSDIKIKFIDNLNFEDNPFTDSTFVGSNSNRAKPKIEDFTDRVIYLDNKLKFLTGKIDQAFIDKHKQLYELMVQQGQNALAEQIFNDYFNTDFDPTFEEKVNFFQNKLTDVTLHKNKMENDKLTLLFLVEIEKSGENKFLDNLRQLALKKEMYEFLIELDEYEEKTRNQSL